MADMFGAPIGISQRTSDDDTHQFRNLQAQEMMGNIAVQPSQLQINQVKAQEAQLDLQMRQKFAAQAQVDQQVGQGRSMADQLDGFAQTAMNAGMVDKAAGFASKASEIRSHAATQASALAMEKERKLKTAIDMMDTSSRLFGNATDDATWNAANRAYPILTGQPSPFEGMSYDPTLAKHIGTQSLSAKDKLEIDLKQHQQDALADLRTQEQTKREADTKLATARTALVQARTTAIEKAGGAGKPSNATNRRMAMDMLVTDWDDIEKPEANRFADQISERATEMMKENPGLKGSEAVTRAYGELKDADAFYGFHPAAKRPTRTTPIPAQKTLAETYGQPYDPAYEYKEEGGKLLRRKK